MESLVSLELITEQSVANSLIDKGLAEVVLRRSDQKYKSFVKCKVLSPEGTSEELADNLLSNIENSFSLEQNRSLINNRSHEKDSFLKYLSLQDGSVFQKADISKYLPYVNSIIAIADFAVDVAGFAMVSQEIRAQSIEIQKLASQIGKVSNVLKNEKIGRFQNLLMQYNAMAENLEYNEILDLDKLNQLIIDIRSFISEMIADWVENAADREVLLHIILTLVPAYTELLSEFVKNYYFQKQRLPYNYETFLSLYDSLEDNKFETHILDYFILDKKVPSIDALDILHAKILIGEKGRMQIEDQLQLIKGLETPENYSKFEEEIDHAVKKQVELRTCGLAGM